MNEPFTGTYCECLSEYFYHHWLFDCECIGGTGIGPMPE